MMPLAVGYQHFADGAPFAEIALRHPSVKEVYFPWVDEPSGRPKLGFEEESDKDELAAALRRDLTRLRGIWVSAGFRGGRWIPAESLQMLGSVAVLSDSPGQRRRMRFSPLFRRATATDGTRLGAITGAEIDEISFAVTALELSRGFWDDLFTPRPRLTRYTADPNSNEVVIDPDPMEKEGLSDEGRHDQGPHRRDADRLRGGDGVRRDELADRAQVEPEGQDDRQLDLRQG